MNTDAEGNGGSERSIPEYFSCPLTLEVMVDPVVDREGNTFERWAILEWLEKEHVSPLSRQPLNEGSLVPNIALRAAIHNYMGTEWSAKQEEASKLVQTTLSDEPLGESSQTEKMTHSCKARRRVDSFLQNMAFTRKRSIRLNDKGIASFRCEDMTVVIEVPDSDPSGIFCVYTTYTVPSLSPVQKDRLLNLNYMQQNTRGGCLAVKKTPLGESEIVYSFLDRAFEVNSSDFQNVLENFIDTAVSLRTEVFFRSRSTQRSKSRDDTMLQLQRLWSQS